MDHMLRKEHINEEWGKVRNPKLSMEVFDVSTVEELI
jgi:hypothetical protein